MTALGPLSHDSPHPTLKHMTADHLDESQHLCWIAFDRLTSCLTRGSAHVGPSRTGEISFDAVRWPYMHPAMNALDNQQESSIRDNQAEPLLEGRLTRVSQSKRETAADRGLNADSESQRMLGLS